MNKCSFFLFWGLITASQISPAVAMLPDSELIFEGALKNGIRLRLKDQNHKFQDILNKLNGKPNIPHARKCGSSISSYIYGFVASWAVSEVTAAIHETPAEIWNNTFFLARPFFAIGKAASNMSQRPKEIFNWLTNRTR
jgi:hypothetical protein